MDIRELVLKKYSVRFGRRSKNRFLDELTELFEEAGYTTHDIQKRSINGLTKNRIFAHEKTAKTYIVVPYDTPDRLFWFKSEFYPLDGNRSANKNLLGTFMPAVLLYVLILLFITFIAPQFQDIGLQLLANIAVLLTTIFLVYLLFHGFHNRNNVNRYSASIIAAVEFMQELSKDQKRRIGFVFTDRNRRRCEGAKLLASYFEEQKKSSDIVMLSCIAQGKRMGVGYRMHGKRMASLLNTGQKAMPASLVDMNGDKSIQTPMFYFEKGVMIACGEQDDRGQLFVTGTQTGKDRKMEEANLTTVKQMLKKLAARIS